MIATKKKTLSVQYLTRIAVLTALSSILYMISIPIVAFYSLDLSNLPVLLGAFSMGPVAGLIILGLKSLIGCLTSSTSMWVSWPTSLWARPLCFPLR